MRIPAQQSPVQALMSSQTDDLLRWFDMIGKANRNLTEEALGPRTQSEVPEIFQSLTASLTCDTERWLEAQNRYYRKYLELWENLLASSAGEKNEPVAAPDKGDRRVHAPE